MEERGTRVHLLNLPLSCHQFFAHCGKSFSVVTPINRALHLHPDRDKCNARTVSLRKTGRPLDDTAITASLSFKWLCVNER